MPCDPDHGYCGRCHRDTTWERAYASRILICVTCRGMVAPATLTEAEKAPPDIAALDSDYEPISLPTAIRRRTQRHATT